MISTWQRYRQERRVEDRNSLVAHYAHLVDRHAARLAKRFPRQISYDEIRSAAFDGLLQAVEGFDPNRNARFETFCQQRIAGAVVDWLRTLDLQSRTVRTFERRRAHMKEMLDHDGGTPLAPADMAARMNLSARRYQRLDQLAQAGVRIHFSAMEAESSDGHGEGRKWDVCDPRVQDPAGPLARQMVAEYLTRGLSRDERMILVLYYYENLTMAEIGSLLNLSESRVSQIHKDVLQRLRARAGRQLAEELAG